MFQPLSVELSVRIPNEFVPIVDVWYLIHLFSFDIVVQDRYIPIDFDDLYLCSLGMSQLFVQFVVLFADKIRTKMFYFQ